MKRARSSRPNPDAHTVTITIPAELSPVVHAGIKLLNAENAIEMIAASAELHAAMNGLLRKRKS